MHLHSLAPLVPFIPLAVSLLSGAEPILTPYQIHEKRAHLPRGWTLTKRLDATSPIPLRIALKQNNIDNIDAYLYDVSHPRSPNYGKHWSPADIARTFAPSDESIDTVRDWLTANGIHEERVSLAHKGWMHVNVTVEEAEQLMMAEYNVYTHTSGKKHVACKVYHLPEHVQAHVDFVTPSVHFDAKLTRRSGGEGVPPPRAIGQVKAGGTVSKIVDGLENCDKQITPSCLRALYEFYYEPVSSDKNSYGIVEYTPQAYLQSDLDLFARNISRDLIGKSPHVISIDGGVVQTVNQSSQYNVESDLDSQYAMSLVTGKQTVTLYQVGDLMEGASFNNFLDALDGSYCTFEGGDDPSLDGIYPDPSPGGYKGRACGTVKPANVISTSYSSDEADLTPFYARRQCAEYAKLGLMGVTFLYSSGDSGVAGNNGACQNPNGTITAGGKIFNPTFPGTCPYVTSVGATMIKPNATVFDSEVACMKSIHSSGGFSNYFATPEYQKEAINYYLTYYRPDYPPNIWNSTGMSRGFPDISANGANYVVAVDGTFMLINGTSCAAPVCGAIFTMINDARLAAGKSPVGFINPVIYSAEFAGAFHDITEGSNPGCDTPGYNATVGWDPVTGLGTPNFAKLLSLWLSLP